MISFTSCAILVVWLSTPSVQSIECGFHATGLEGSITGPMTGSNYQRETFKCEWTITVPPLYRVALKFGSNKIDGLEGGHCTMDYFLIDSLTESGIGTLHGIFCGTTTAGKIITSSENKLRIWYYYKGHTRSTYSYFSFTYKAVPLTPREIAQYYIEKRELKKENLPRAVSSLFLINATYFEDGNSKAENITNWFRLQLGEDLVRNFSRPMAAGDIAVRVSGLLAVCISPRSFYGIDLVYHLRHLLNNMSGTANPYIYLTLCNAGDEITDSDVQKLTTVLETQKHEMFWLDYQAMALLTLVCVRERDLGYNVKHALTKGLTEIKSYQFQDGGFGSLQTTSLVVQAITAAETNESGWNKTAAINFIKGASHSDGSYGSIQNLYAVVPIITGKTLLDINASNCDFSKDELNEIRSNNSKSIQLVYSVWIGDHVDVSSTVTLKAPKGTKFLDFMRLAADQDLKFEFKWINMKNSPHVYEIGGLINDPSTGRYWTLYTGMHAMNLEPHSKGLEHYVPQNGEMAAMWYKTVTV